MPKISRRELLQRTGAAAATTAWGGFKVKDGMALSAGEGDSPVKRSFEWIRSARLLIGEGYTPPFYPSLDYDPEKALALAQRLNCDSFRYPTFSYLAFFPTKTKFPHHPELGSSDPFHRTVELFHHAGLKVVAYNPLNHPFMDVRSDNPDYADWRRYGADGKPFTTSHYGWTRFYEGCLNSPLRDQIKLRVREVVTNYPVDMMYFDGPYEGMNQRMHFCHCRYCKEAYRKARNKDIPLQNDAMTLEDEIEYSQWLAQDVVTGFMQEICAMVREVRDVPVVYNDTGLIGGDWRAKAFPHVDGFMFEAADTPEQKLFNMRIGQSTGKVIWTYISTHTEYNVEHLQDKSMRGWYSYPIGAERMLLDASVATAAGVGYCYWGLNRLFYVPQGELDGEYERNIRRVFDFVEKYGSLLRATTRTPQAGILTGTQTIQWYRNPMFVRPAYKNYYYGAYQLLKDLGYDAEPFLDYQATRERLAKYKLVFVPNAACLSEAQCSALAGYVEAGGVLIATHLTSVADEYGRPRSNFGLAELFGAELVSPDPVESPDLYLRLLPSGKLIPQDSQIMNFKAGHGAVVLAETYSRGYRRTLGPAIVTRPQGSGRVIYIGSGLEAIYEETLLEPLRAYFRSLLDPVLKSSRTFEVEFRPGLMPQFAASGNTLLLHLLADTGNIRKKLLLEEEYLPITNIHVRMRLPQNRTAKSAALMWSGDKISWNVRDGWVELVVPQVRIYEVVRVDLS